MSHRRAVDVDPADWAALDDRVGGRLLRVESPLQRCIEDRRSEPCVAVLRELTNPFFNEDEPGAFQTTGWLGAYVAEPSPYAVAASTAGDIAAAVTFARDHDVPLVVKGTGHDYLGRSSAPDALLIWTHHMREIVVHDDFAITGGSQAGTVPAITVGAGTRWLEVYQAAASRDRYVQGGGCTSVGAAGGFTQGGGFGSFSKKFGTAAGNVLEIEVVTADGDIITANEGQHQDLFWALRGGGGGTFGVVSKMTLRTHPMPTTVGAALGTITASSDADYRCLIRELLTFLAASLDNEHWGEQIRLAGDNSMQVMMTFLDLDEDAARAVWRPLTDWLARSPDGFTADIHFASQPFDTLWDVDWWDQHLPDFITRDRRPDSPLRQFWWTSNQGEVSQHLDGYKSRWLPIRLFEGSAADILADGLFEATRHWPCTLHANKGLSGAAPDALARDRNTSINPAAFDAAALLISASSQREAYPGLVGHEPNMSSGAENARRVDAAMGCVRAVTPGAGAYVNEADYFEPDWEHSFWGSNYARLLEVKRRYDPNNVFRVHHGVGSET